MVKKIEDMDCFRYDSSVRTDKKNKKQRISQIMHRIIIWLGIVVIGCLLIPFTLLLTVISTVWSLLGRISTWASANIP